jgi:hypothetical protein
MFDHHDFTGGQTCGKHHEIKTKPESEYDHLGQELLHDVIEHKKHHPHYHDDQHHGPRHVQAS